MLTTNVDMDYKESIQNPIGGRFPFRSEPPKQFNIAFRNGSNQWRQELHIAKYGGADLRGHGYPCRLFCYPQKKASLTLRRLAMSNTQSLSIQKSFGNVKLSIIPDKVHEFVLSTAEVARGYGATINAIHQCKQRHSDEIIENIHFLSRLTKCQSRENLQTKQIFWTKQGIVKLGFFVKSNIAKEFRTWAENLIIEKLEPKPIKSKRPALPQGSDFRKGTCDGIYYYEPMTQYGRIPVGILHGINTAAE